MARSLVLEASPQAPEQDDHMVQSDTTQSMSPTHCGPKQSSRWDRRAAPRSAELHHEALTTKRRLSRSPCPHVALHDPQLPQSEYWQPRCTVVDTTVGVVLLTMGSPVVEGLRAEEVDGCWDLVVVRGNAVVAGTVVVDLGGARVDVAEPTEVCEPACTSNSLAYWAASTNPSTATAQHTTPGSRRLQPPNSLPEGTSSPKVLSFAGSSSTALLDSPGSSSSASSSNKASPL
mmetsp:Transcript_52181/g.138183  ORF Transcript_52181/g.138183 Transcript_52181/m.138183 type:complete len:232 (+) Transcript_52181:4815-5510(+)